MIILDANILLYAVDTAAAQHRAIREWFEGLAASGSWIGLPWLSLWAFLRIATNPRIMKSPLVPEEAFDVIGSWLALPRTVPLSPGARHPELLRKVAKDGGVTGAHFTDAALAAIAIEYGASLASTDRGFARFRNLEWINPLDGH